jgi:hypothetical protein
MHVLTRLVWNRWCHAFDRLLYSTLFFSSNRTDLDVAPNGFGAEDAGYLDGQPAPASAEDVGYLGADPVYDNRDNMEAPE